MKILKIIISILLIFLIIGYAIALAGNYFAFCVFFSLSPLILFISIFFSLFLFTTNRIWKSLSQNMQDIFGKDKLWFKTIILLWSIFFFFLAWLINYFCLPGKFHPISLLGDTGILFFMVFLGWSLIKQSKKKMIFVGSFVFILFISLLTYVSSKTSIHAELTSSQLLQSPTYQPWLLEKEKSGVTKYDPERSFKGLNIYTPYNVSSAYLVDMSGNILHTWSEKAKINKDNVNWSHIKMLENGDLLVVCSNKMLIRLDWNSNVKWIKEMCFHHDVAVADNKDIYALSLKNEVVFYAGLPVPICSDYIVVLSPDGKIKKEISLFKALKKEIPFDMIIKIYRRMINYINLKRIFMFKKPWKCLFISQPHFDISSSNTTDIVDRNIDGLCKKGDLLIVIKMLSLIAILDIEKEKIIWKWGPKELIKPHNLSLLENGNILIFDNGDINRGYSRIVELNPLTKKIVWEYKADPPESFCSLFRGAAQRLPNGNTMITESDEGHVFEVTKDGEIVWEFYVPTLMKYGEEEGRIPLYRMTRITDSKNYFRINELK